MATGRFFLCLLPLLVTQESHGKTLCPNPTEMYRTKGTIANPECSIKEIDENKVCYVGCKRGGVMVLQCNKHGHWDVQDYCLKVYTECLEVDVINADEIVKRSDGDIGKTMEFRCHEDFVIKGHQKITCQKDYSWDHEEPVCESRRYTHEVVKAMKTLFFPKINYNNNRGVDVIILLDVSRNEWVRITVDLIKSLLLHCEEHHRRNLYTLITYGNEGYLQCNACNRTTTIQEIDKVAKHPHHHIGSNLGSGLSRIFTDLLMRDRLSLDRGRILLLVTGQNPGISHNHQLWTEILREDAAFKMFVVALGDRVNKDELRLMADQPWQDHFFYLKYSQILEAVGNLTDNESEIVNTTGQLLQQVKGHVKAGDVSRLLLYVEAINSTETFDLIKQVAQNMIQCIHQPELKVALNVDNWTVFRSVDTVVESLKVLQAEALLNFDTLLIHLVRNKDICKNLQIILFLSGQIFDINMINDVKDLGCVIYAVGVGEQPGMQELQKLVSFPWYHHLAHASEATVECDG